MSLVHGVVEALQQLQGQAQQAGQNWQQTQERPHSGASALLDDGGTTNPSLLLQQLLSAGGDMNDSGQAGVATGAGGGAQGTDDGLRPGLMYDAPGARQPEGGSTLLHSDAGGAYGAAGPSGQQHQQQQDPQGPTYIQSGLALPNAILVSSNTEPLQAAGLVNFCLGQGVHSSFVLNTRMDSAGSTPVSVLTAALRVVLSARKLNVNQRFDLGFVPFLVTDAADGIGLLIYKCSINPDKTRGQVLKMEPSSNPLVAGISLFNMLQSGNQQLEVIFTTEAAKVALQALSIMRINLANNGRDVLMLLSTVDYTADAAGPKNYFLLKLAPITPPLPCFLHQIEAPKPPPQQQGYLADPMGMGIGMMAAQHHAGMGGMMAGAGGKAAGQRGGPGPSQGMGMGGYGGQQLGMGVGVGGPAMGPAASSAKQARARKADYVIVTEDTAIKNAAGAIAKVLGRVSNQGQCCPVYTEKKTESFTTVISVAVKAVAVARGYVCNEGMGHEVGFQPYLRHLDRRLDLVDLHNFLAADKKGGMGGGMGGPSPAAMLTAAGLGMMVPGQHPQHGLMGGQKGPGMGGMGMGGGGMVGGLYGGMGGGMGYGGGGGYGSKMGGGSVGLEALELLDEEALQDERCELAFDVFKVPQQQELQDAGNLPVKVTAHSRPNVVSNIITKLVSERNGAVLITAGGKAMHVAMTAVVSSRARLRLKGIDIILLPKFVTVDTTSTLGWESVFLRFTIVRWAPALPQAAPMLSAESMVAGRYLLQPQMG